MQSQSRFRSTETAAARRVALALVVAVVTLTAIGQSPARAGAPEPLPFTDDFERGAELAAASGRPLVVVFGVAWCPYCLSMQRHTFRTAEVLALAHEFIWVRQDVDRDISAARQWGIDVVPQVLVLTPEGRLAARAVGSLHSPDLATLLHGVMVRQSEPQNTTEPEPILVHSGSTPLTYTPDGFRGRSTCFSNVGYGPLAISSESPFQSLRHGLVPRTPSNLARGEWQAHVAATWANIWAHNDDYTVYLLDYETVHTAGSFSYGLSDTVQVELAVDNRRAFGGTLDGFIEGFHDLFSLGQDERDLSPRGRFRILLAPRNGVGGVELDGGDAGSFSRTVAMTVQHSLTCGNEHWPAVAMAATARFEIGEPAFLSGGSGTDLGLALSLSRRWNAWYGYLTVGATWFGREFGAGIPLEDRQLSLLVAAEWRLRPQVSLIAQYLATEGVAVDFKPFSQPTNELTIGVKWELAQSTVLELGFIENVATFDNSPDFGIHAGVSARF